MYKNLQKSAEMYVQFNVIKKNNIIIKNPIVKKGF